MVRQGLVLGIAMFGLVGVSRAGEVTLGHDESGHVVLEENGRELGTFSREPDGALTLDRDSEDVDWDNLKDADDDDDDD